MSTIFINDIAFIKALKQGEPKAYRFLVDNYHHKLCIYALNLTNDHYLSEDIVQNVFLKIWRLRSKLRDNFNFKSYLYKSVYNEFIDHYRSQKTFITIDKIHLNSLTTIVEDDNEDSLEKLIARVKKEIENLPPKCKQTFLLSKQEGLTNIEIAEYLKISIKTVEAHISKAFSILRNTLDDKMEGVFFLLIGIKEKPLILK